MIIMHYVIFHGFVVGGVDLTWISGLWFPILVAMMVTWSCFTGHVCGSLRLQFSFSVKDTYLLCDVCLLGYLF